MIIKLTLGELREARNIAYELAIHWYGIRKNTALLLQAIIGVCGEMAAIKYFNDKLGAEPRIKINKIYTNGCDGGVDFWHPSDLSWDVKVITNGSKYILKTKAECIIGVVKLDKNTYAIAGYAPTSRLRSTPVENWEWIPIHSLKTLFPKHFPHNPKQSLKPQLKQIKTDLNNVMLPIKWRHITKSNEV